MTNATIGPWSLRVAGLRAGTVLPSVPVMIRSELIARIAAQNPHLYTRDVEVVVDTILDRIARALVAGDRVELRDFGTFCIRDREARASRNPRTGEAVRVEAKAAIQFKAGKGMRTRLNRRQANPEPEAEVQRLLRAS